MPRLYEVASHVKQLPFRPILLVLFSVLIVVSPDATAFQTSTGVFVSVFPRAAYWSGDVPMSRLECPSSLAVLAVGFPAFLKSASQDFMALSAFPFD